MIITVAVSTVWNHCSRNQRHCSSNQLTITGHMLICLHARIIAGKTEILSPTDRGRERVDRKKIDRQIDRRTTASSPPHVYPSTSHREWVLDIVTTPRKGTHWLPCFFKLDPAVACWRVSGRKESDREKPRHNYGSIVLPKLSERWARGRERGVERGRE